MLANSYDHTCSRSTLQLVNGSHDFNIVGYSRAKGMGAGKYIASDTFSAGGHDWVIRFYPDGKNSYPDDHFSVYIVLTSHGSNVRSSFKLRLLNKSGKGGHTFYGGPSTRKLHGRLWGHSYFFSRERLETLGYLTDDCFSMHCTVGVFKQFNIPITPSDMGRDLNYLLETETGCDILLLVGDQTLKAHKVILAAGSPVFKAMFFGLLGNPNMNELELKEVKPSVFKAMLLFIYSNTLPDLMSSDVVEQLLPVADRFGVQRLKDLCEAKLSEEVNVDTVATALCFADKHHCPQLKFICLKFASENLEEVMKTQGFKYLTEACPLLLSELLQTTKPKAAARTRGGLLLS
ncbi:BTB/POZ and MATH domain-containing protein 3-like [Bidens hawaiensis]|uniref:BTB/POZ and MATH domain-containing protein 3-like n=1 Tax=Bidens hawaiensis TaxID=980011 RepID=UPI00404A5685